MKTSRVLDKNGLRQTPLLCIDPWIGDLGELFYRENWEKHIAPGEITYGRSTAYYQFMLNIKQQIETGEIASKHIIPMPVASTIGARCLAALNITPDVVYLDSAHEKDETFTGLSLYFHRLTEGGVIFGDDYTWDGVKANVGRFSARNNLKLELVGHSWILKKPASVLDAVMAPAVLRPLIRHRRQTGRIPFVFVCVFHEISDGTDDRWLTYRRTPRTRMSRDVGHLCPTSSPTNNQIGTPIFTF